MDLRTRKTLVTILFFLAVSKKMHLSPEDERDQLLQKIRAISAINKEIIERITTSQEVRDRTYSAKITGWSTGGNEAKLDTDLVTVGETSSSIASTLFQLLG
jgi:hypothetical protein